jgi:hypothetical protein
MNETKDGTELYARQEGFAAPDPTDEYLHGLAPDADYTASETSYLGFNIPEVGINAEIYHWFHPHLRVASGGLMIWQGHKSLTGAADFLDYRNFLPYPSGDIDDIVYPTGVHVRVLEPLAHLTVSFESPDGRVHLELDCQGVMPAAGRADRKHFAQAVRCTGVLGLDGTRHVIDGYFTRDRSYLAPRVEVSHPIAPQTWGAAVFGDDLAFHFVGPDSDELSDAAIHWGYVWRAGELRRPVRMRKHTVRDTDGITPVAATIDIEDSAGEMYRLRGTSKALLPMCFWPNMVTNLVQMRYQLADRIGYGDYQDILFGHYLRTRS